MTNVKRKLGGKPGEFRFLFAAGNTSEALRDIAAHVQIVGLGVSRMGLYRRPWAGLDFPLSEELEITIQYEEKEENT